MKLNGALMGLVCMSLFGSAQGQKVYPPVQSANLASGFLQTRTFSIEADKELTGHVQAFFQDYNIKPGKGPRLQISIDTSLPSESYTLKVGDSVSLVAGSKVGVAWGLSTLGQLGQGGQIRTGTYSDKPDVEFRAVLLDVARRYHSPSTLRTLVRYCAAAKVRYIQLHLTDDQNWMLPTKVLKGIDRNNTHGRPTYTEREMRELQAFASYRGVTIYPEVDLPGHSAILTKHDPDLFRLKGSESTNCVNFGSTKVRNTLKALLAELYDLFPESPYIHLGGDEAWYPNADKDPEIAESMKRLGEGKTAQDVFVDFVGELADDVIKKKKTPIVWEGFGPSEFAKKRIPKQTQVVAWEGVYYPPAQLVADGYQIINAGWDPHYVVNHYPYNVNTHVPLEKILKSPSRLFGMMEWHDPAKASYRFPDTIPLLGNLMCWWEGNEWNAHETLPTRMVAFGAGLWNTKNKPNYNQFLSEFEKIESRVNKASFPFQVDLNGLLKGSQTKFTGDVTITVKGDKELGFAIRTDGQPPQPSDVAANGSAKVSESSFVMIQAFRGQLPVGEMKVLPLKKSEVVTSLTTNCKLEYAGDNDPQFPVSNVVDGISNDQTGYWAAYPKPIAVTVDLGKALPVTTLEVHGLVVGGAPTYYTVEGSLDKKSWKMLADRSSNKEAPTEKGYRDRIPTQNFRYLRLTALGSGMHPSPKSRILEFRAFSK